MDLPRVRLFVSSPGDVEAERKRLEQVMERLNGVFREAVAIDVIRWENEFYTADRPFQAQIAEASETDVVVAILWSRIGTPLGAPDAPRRADGSAYESGTVYEIETALLASRTKGVPDLYVFRKVAPPVVSLDDKERLRLAEEQYELLLAFWRKWFQGEDGYFQAAFQTFATTDAFEEQVEALLRHWLAAKGYVARGPIWDVRIKGSPFRGLEPFEEQHARVFFGRAFAVERCRERLIEAMERGAAFLLVLGASGAGKSSLARAGLIPRLTAPGAVPGVDLWRRAIFRPGPRPFAALAAALLEADALPELSTGDFPVPDDLARQLAAVPEDAARPVVRALDRAAVALSAAEGRERAPDDRLLLVVDQLEEAFVGEGDTAAAFGRALAAFAASGRIAVIATLRGDRYADLLACPPLLALKETGVALDLPLPGESDIEAIIREPVRAAGLRFERRLAEGPDLGEELQAAAGGADALPLLQMTLEALFRARAGDTLTIAAYDALGGLEGAIAARAEAALDGLPETARAELPALLRALTRIGGAEGEFATQPCARDRFATSPERRALVDALVSERLLVADRDYRVRVAHEALLRRWARAQDILKAERDFLHVRDRLAPLAADWHAKTGVKDPRAEDYLLPAGPLLSSFDALKAAGRDADLPDDIRTFAARSAVAAKRAASRKVRNLRTTVAGLSALTLATAIAGVIAWQQWQTAQRHFELALGAAKGVVYDLAQEFGDVEGMRADTVAKILGTAEGLYDRLVEAVPNNPELLHEQAGMLDEFAKTYMKRGDLGRARSGRAFSLDHG